jgi:hypothetical protein
MDITPDNPQRNETGTPPDAQPSPDQSAGSRPSRIERASHRRPPRPPHWNIEMLEWPLLDTGIPYMVHDAPPCDTTAKPISWIEFTRPTNAYRDRCGDYKVLIRLTVDDGRLAVTAPDVYPRDSLRRTSTPPPDRDGNLRIVRLGEYGQPQIDLTIAADGAITAALRMETIQRPFTRREIVQIADLFAEGIDFLDFVVRQHGLLIENRGSTDD